MLRTEMNHHYADLVERIDTAQTSLLKAFYSFAESNQRRLTAAEQEAAAQEDRLAILESRLTDVERRLKTPPAA